MAQRHSATAIYCRISDDATGHGLGVKRQQADCEAFCAARGWPVAAVHIDNDRSAYSGRRRPEYEALCAGIDDGRYDSVVVWHPDRLHRSPAELETFIDLVERSGVDVATVTAGDLDLSTPDGRLTARIVGSVARKESEDKSRRIRRAHQEIAERGRPSGGGRRPFGYEFDKVTVNETEAALIREAADAVLAGVSMRSIVTGWNEKGVRTVTGANWSSQTIKQMLIAARMSGQREHHGHLSDAVWPAIIERDKWLRLRSLLGSRPSTAPTTARSHLLSGLLVCGRCQTPLTAAPVTRPNGRRVDRYRCTIERGGCGRCGIIADPTEQLVVDALLAALDTPQLAKARAAKLATPTDEPDPVDAVAELEARMAELAEMYAAGEINRTEWATARDSIERRLTDARRIVADANRTETAVRTLHNIGRLADDWPNLDLDTRRTIASTVIDKIAIAPTSKANNRFDPDRVDIVWAA